jgi:predicted nucleic acid-binding protein
VILVDAGPLVALIHADDANHIACSEALQAVREPLGTSWPVVTEAMYLLGFSWSAQQALWEMIETSAFHLLPLDVGDAPRIRELMRKYRDLPMDLADATLVRLAERERTRKVFTIDRRDFSIYRPLRLGRFQVIP